MKKKTSKIVKNRERPKMDRAELDALVKELSRPERLAREADKLLRRIRDDPALAALRFDAAALLAAAAAEGATPASVADALVADDARARARATLEARAKEGGQLDEILPYRVGVFLLDAEGEKKRPPSQNPFWLGVLSASALELPVALYLGARDGAEVAAEAAEGRAGPPFKAFLDADPRIATLRKVVPQIDLESLLIAAMLAFGAEAHEIALPLHAALKGPIEAARAARRRQALAGVGSPASAQAEHARTLMAAVEKDKERAVPAYRREVLDRFAEAAREGATARLGRLLSIIVALEELPPSKNVPLMAAYEAAGARALEEAEEWERPLLEAILRRPLEPAGYREYARKLLASDPARGKAFAEAAVAAFPDDKELSIIQ